jgi:N-acyl homoserine lactone hydrolase
MNHAKKEWVGGILRLIFSPKWVLLKRERLWYSEKTRSVKTMDMKISFLYLGRMEFPLFRLVETPDETKMVRSPAVALLIQHPTLGNILYDTGNSPDFATEYTEAMLHDYPVAEMVTVTQALAEKGLSPKDIDGIILSHLHFDHAGGLKQFVGTRAIKNVLVSEADLKNAYFSVMTGNGGAYIRSLFDVEGIRFQTINEDTKLGEGIEAFIQQSHTPGVIGLILETKHNGTLITTSDTVYTRESYERELPPGGTINKTPEEFYDNLKRIKRMEKERGATLIFGHDYEQFQAWAAKGWID